METFIQCFQCELQDIVLPSCLSEPNNYLPWTINEYIHSIAHDHETNIFSALHNYPRTKERYKTVCLWDWCPYLITEHGKQLQSSFPHCPKYCTYILVLRIKEYLSSLPSYPHSVFGFVDGCARKGPSYSQSQGLFLSYQLLSRRY